MMPVKAFDRVFGMKELLHTYSLWSLGKQKAILHVVVEGGGWETADV